MKQLTITLFLLLGISLSAEAQTIYYVKSNGNGNGTTWYSASGSLQQVINNANAGDQVYVAAGTYRGGFVMKEGVNVLGGFPANASNTTTLADRKLPGTGLNLTILDGLNQMRVLTQEKDFSQKALWEGFVLKNGNTTGVGTIVYHKSKPTEPAGIVFAYDATTQTAKMIALEQSVQIKWGPLAITTDVTGLVNGATNWTRMNAYMNGRSWDAYPVWKYIKELRETTQPGGYADWYLPAIKELEEVYAQRAALNAVLKNSGKTELTSYYYYYWAGSESDSYDAWSVDFSNGVVVSHPKNRTSPARAVRVLTLSDLTIWQGGGAYLRAGGVLRNSVVQDCQASTIGGGAYLNTGARMEGCVVEGCVAKEASAVYVAEDAHLLSSTIVKNNVERAQAYEIMNAPLIGDYYYLNGTWGSNASGAIGIVCYIDPNNSFKGYILHKDEHTDFTITWHNSKKWVATLGSGWNLPSLEVLYGIYYNKEKLNSKLSQMKGTLLDDYHMYWSSKEVNNLDAWFLSLYDGSVGSNTKYDSHPARAVRAF